MGLAVTYRSLSRALVAVGIAGAAVAHGLFDYFAIHGDTWLAVATQGSVVLAFVSYVSTGSRIERDLAARLDVNV